MKLYQAIYLRVFFLLILFILFVQIGYAKPQIHNNVFNATSKSGSVLVEILLNENISQNEVIVDLQSMDNGFNMIQKRYSPRSIVANILSADGRVSRVDVIRSTNLHLAESRQVIKSTYINDNLAYKGRGATACIIDTGIDVDNSHFSGKIVDEACFCLGDGIKGCCPNSLPSQFGPGAAQDDHGHGTHISGIVAADGWFTKGIAPEATLLVAKACNKDMTCTFPDLQDAVSWCMNKITTPTKEVITLSNGVGIFGSSQYCDNEYLGFLIGQAYNLGIPVVASSGNNGSLNGITFPACSSGAISVGSTYDDTFLRKPLIGDWEGANCHDSFIQPDNVSCYTNRHEILDLLAPGCDIKSTGLNSLFRESKCGTSMASPHVAAAILLLQEAARGTLSPLEIRERLKESGKIIHDTSNSRDNGPPSGLWFPRLDILAAFQLDWPTYQHDNRRTGFTLLKGDMQNSKDVEQLDFLFRVGGTEDLFSRSVVSDIDGDDDLETVFFSVYGTPEHPEGWLFVIETDKEGKILRENKIGELFVGDAANGPPIVANTDDDAEKEIVVGLANGTVYLIDAQPS
ncbi:S8 family serine peptidase, partial [Candidatus Woesearchaeota archaeon]|nr:S8 family serine peptidase [Candidatus Woesearchaeota archaeon]